MYVAMYYRRVARMVRKQLYIEARQDRLLKRRARQLGVTEAALIREGIDLLDATAAPAIGRERALEDYLRVVRDRARIRVAQTARGWTREELYEERLARYGPPRH